MDEQMWQVVQSFQRFMDEAVGAARERERSDQPGLYEIVQEHLGVAPSALPLVTEQIDAQRVVDADIALELVADRDQDGRLLGISGGNARQHHDLSEMLGDGVHFRHFGIGAPDYLSMPTGPDTDRRILVMGLRLSGFAADLSPFCSVAPIPSSAGSWPASTSSRPRRRPRRR